MEPLIESGYVVIQRLQQFRSAPADTLFRALSLLGEELFYLLLVPPLYWLLDKRLATRFSVLFLVSVYLNMLFKAVLDQPRPAAGRVQVLIADPGEGGLPSGHAQNAVVTWGFVAASWTQRWLRVLFVALIFGIGVSRVYLGVHFPHDVVVGWGLGLLILLLYFRMAPRGLAWFDDRRLAVQLAAGGGITLLLLLLYRGGTALAAVSTLFGLALGVPLERRYIRYDARWLGGWRAAVRLALGFAVVFLIWRGLRSWLLPLDEPGVFLRYSLLGLWISAGAPEAFVRLGLARRHPSPLTSELRAGVH